MSEKPMTLYKVKAFKIIATLIAVLYCGTACLTSFHRDNFLTAGVFLLLTVWLSYVLLYTVVERG